MMAYAWKSLGWFLSSVAVTLGFLLVPLQVAGERKKLDRTVAQIEQAKTDIRSLETEFETRANLAQLERWNGDTLRLAAPTAGQFLADAGALAQVNFQPLAPGDAEVKTAAYVVPSAPTAQPVLATPTPAPVMTAAVATRPVAHAPEARVARAVATANSVPVISRVALQGRIPAVTHAKSQTVAMLDRKLLSDSTIGDLMSNARAEAKNRR